MFRIPLIALVFFLFSNCNRDVKTENKLKTQLHSTAVEEQVWFLNTQYGLVIETPERLNEKNLPQPQGTNNIVSDLKSFIYTKDDFAINHMVLFLVNQGYNVKEGLRGGVTNMVNHVGGHNLKIEFFEPDGLSNQMYCDASFTTGGTHMQMKGFCFYNDANQVNLVVGLSNKSGTSRKTLKRAFESIRIL